MFFCGLGAGLLIRALPNMRLKMSFTETEFLKVRFLKCIYENEIKPINHNNSFSKYLILIRVKIRLSFWNSKVNKISKGLFQNT